MSSSLYSKNRVVAFDAPPNNATVNDAIDGQILFGRMATSQDIAVATGASAAARAVGGAVGANPVSLVIPCHQVILESGIIHDYRWGVDRRARHPGDGALAPR